MQYISRNIDLPNTGFCEILAIENDGTLYVEEFYDNEWIAQHVMAPDGTFIQTSDEMRGKQPLQPITIPKNLSLKNDAVNFPALHYDAGAALTGIGAEDYIHSLVHPLEMTDRMRLADDLQLSVPAFTVIGISFSRITWASPYTDNQWIVCRKIGIAHTLPEKPAQYATEIRYLLQQVSPPGDLLNVRQLPIDGLHCPQQAIWQHSRLYIADSGGPDGQNRVLIYSDTP